MVFLEDIYLSVMDVVDISSSFESAIVGGMFIIVSLGEINVQIPLLMESIWLLVGFQSLVNSTALLNTALMFLAAQAGRQISMLALYYFLPVISKPLSKLLTKLGRFNRFDRRHFNPDHFDARYLSSLPATLGMLTWLSMPLKLLLIWQRRLKPLLVGTLFSGMVFDGIYLLAGAVFRTTSPNNIVYLPAVFLAVFLGFMFVQIMVVKKCSPS